MTKGITSSWTTGLGNRPAQGSDLDADAKYACHAHHHLPLVWQRSTAAVGECRENRFVLGRAISGRRDNVTTQPP